MKCRSGCDVTPCENGEGRCANDEECRGDLMCGDDNVCHGICEVEPCGECADNDECYGELICGNDDLCRSNNILGSLLYSGCQF